MKSASLLEGYLEKISGKVLEAYPHVVRDMIRGRHGVYALYKGSRLYYVGLASNLMNRLKNHLKDRHQSKWDRFSVYLTVQASHIKELECLLLCIASPNGNRAGGRFARSQNLFSRLNRSLKEADSDRRASILGGHVAERRRRSKALRLRGNQALAGFADRTIALRATYRGKTHRARLRPNGEIRIGKRTFTSPSAAARSIVKRQVNGWSFWQYRDRTNRWRPLGSIKK